MSSLIAYALLCSAFSTVHLISAWQEFLKRTPTSSMAFNDRLVDTAQTPHYLKCVSLCANNLHCNVALHSSALSQCALLGTSTMFPSMIESPYPVSSWTSAYAKPSPPEVDPFPCNHSYVQSVPKCYSFEHGATTWAGSKTRCESQGGRLITFSSEEQFLRFQAHILTNPPGYSSRDKYFIGLFKNSNDDWEWLGSGNILSVDSNIWGSGYPNSLGTFAMMDGYNCDYLLSHATTSTFSDCSLCEYTY